MFYFSFVKKHFGTRERTSAKDYSFRVLMVSDILQIKAMIKSKHNGHGSIFNINAPLWSSLVRLMPHFQILTLLDFFSRTQWDKAFFYFFIFLLFLSHSSPQDIIMRLHLWVRCFTTVHMWQTSTLASKLHKHSLTGYKTTHSDGGRCHIVLLSCLLPLEIYVSLYGLCQAQYCCRPSQRLSLSLSRYICFSSSLLPLSWHSRLLPFIM